MRFILVDDEPACNLISKFTIKRLFKEDEIEVFTDPEKALAYIKNTYVEGSDRTPTCVFLDINMPIMSGWEFLEEYNSFGTDVHKCISTYIVSSSIDVRDKEKAADNPLVAGFISKPLRVEQLEEIIGAGVPVTR
jgi:CheY-like chemotaxis protein